ncbi:MAG: phosphatase PAP2 family protein [Elusimicrobiaceae bacterium]|nr:phosphatase PAP2 family protein [Elusimicrobiaceae bacterium]
MKKIRNLIIIGALLLTGTWAVCAPVTQLQEAGSASSTIQFPPPPAAGSEEDRADNAAVHKWQDERTEQQCAAANAQAYATYEELFGGLSPFKKPVPENVQSILTHLRKEVNDTNVQIKNRYKRPRPFRMDSTIDPCLGRIGGYSYPSGHAAISRMFGRLLADLVPAQRKVFMDQADQCALYRVIGGVHNPSDIEAGKLVGDIKYEQFLRDPDTSAQIESLKVYLSTP